MKKKILFTLIVLPLFLSCDKNIDYDYYIINNCNKSINVILTDHKEIVLSYLINSKAELLVYQANGINSLQDRLVEYFIKEIKISIEDNILIMNPINKNVWDFKPTSKTHANSYLTIKSEDFEQ